MPSLEFIWAYFTSPMPLTVLLGSLFSITALSSIFRFASNSKVRSRILGGILSSSVFVWTFVGTSLALCNMYIYAGLYEYEFSGAIKLVFGQALVVALVSAIPASMLLKYIIPRFMLRRIDEVHELGDRITKLFAAASSKIGLDGVELLVARARSPPSFALSGRRRLVVISEQLLSILDDEELEAVLAHELAHIKNGDSVLKALASTFRAILPFDPVIQLVEPAFQRERELLADEMAATVTRKPLALASALLKIYEAHREGRMTILESLSIIGFRSGLFGRHPSLKVRIEKLLKLAEEAALGEN